MRHSYTWFRWNVTRRVSGGGFSKRPFQFGNEVTHRSHWWSPLVSKRPQWQCTSPVLRSMWQHFPGGELFRHPPPCARAASCAVKPSRANMQTTILMRLPPPQICMAATGSLAGELDSWMFRKVRSSLAKIATSTINCRWTSKHLSASFADGGRLARLTNFVIGCIRSRRLRQHSNPLVTL